MDTYVTPFVLLATLYWAPKIAPDIKSYGCSFRPFIPPRQRIRFDEITRHQQQHMAKVLAHDIRTNTSQTSHKLGKRR